MKRLFLLAVLGITGWLPAAAQVSQLIPTPAQISYPATKGSFTLNPKTQIIIHSIGHENAFFYLNDQLRGKHGLALLSWMDTPIVKNAIHLNYARMDHGFPGAYTITVNKDGVYIEGDNATGVFYGVQTFLQLLPAEKLTTVSIPFMTITDYPRFRYRGFMLDAGRHFTPVQEVKKIIDQMARMKMNYFHWHLTDDQGWRIQIKKYPELTQKGAWRNGTLIGRYPGKGNDNKQYGGYYTQEQIHEIVEYAEKRYITIVPEIELPGHSSAAIAAFPWLSCFPDQKSALPASMSSIASLNSNGKIVQESWGVFDDVFCAGNDSTFTFLENVMTEVMQLFPGKYIHIGGDECPKSNWKKCPRCQQRMKTEGLKNEEELQSYFIQRMEGYLNKRGRSIIGWDEILEGGLAQNAIVMSWRGEEGGIEAARQKHEVVMTPGDYVYINRGQSLHEDSINIGGYLPLHRVYGYEPIPKELNATEAKYVLGAQANLWTEYINNPSLLEYMVFPRLSALSEVLWSPKNKRNWNHFASRLPSLFKRLDFYGFNYSKAVYDLSDSVYVQNGKLYWKLRSLSEHPIQAGLNFDVSNSSSYRNDSLLPFYKGPINIYNSVRAEALIFDKKNNKKISALSRTFQFHKAVAKTVKLDPVPAEKYRGNGGNVSLVNGLVSEKGIESDEWLGWQGKDMKATIDLVKAEKISSVTVHALEQKGSWIHLPTEIEVWVSVDGMKYKKVGSGHQFVASTAGMGTFTISFEATTARWVMVKAKHAGIIPAGFAGEGNPSWIFIDEIQVN